MLCSGVETQWKDADSGSLGIDRNQGSCLKVGRHLVQGQDNSIGYRLGASIVRTELDDAWLLTLGGSMDRTKIEVMGDYGKVV